MIERHYYQRPKGKLERFVEWYKDEIALVCILVPVLLAFWSCAMTFEAMGNR